MQNHSQQERTQVKKVYQEFYGLKNSPTGSIINKQMDGGWAYGQVGGWACGWVGAWVGGWAMDG